MQPIHRLSSPRPSALGTNPTPQSAALDSIALADGCRDAMRLDLDAEKYGALHELAKGFNEKPSGPWADAPTFVEVCRAFASHPQDPPCEQALRTLARVFCNNMTHALRQDIALDHAESLRDAFACIPDSDHCIGAIAELERLNPGHEKDESVQNVKAPVIHPAPHEAQPLADDLNALEPDAALCIQAENAHAAHASGRPEEKADNTTTPTIPTTEMGSGMFSPRSGIPKRTLPAPSGASNKRPRLDAGEKGPDPFGGATHFVSPHPLRTKSTLFLFAPDTDTVPVFEPGPHTFPTHPAMPQAALNEPPPPQGVPAEESEDEATEEKGALRTGNPLPDEKT